MLRRTFWTGLAAAIGMLMMILDSKTGIYGASEGLRLCIQVLIPSLFPFIFLSILLTGSLAGRSIRVLAPLGRLCGIPKGGEVLFLTGILGGYPTGAQAVTQAWETGCISKKQAGRMLGFCNNAGPSFLFGILAAQFSSKTTVWVLWLIHILSAVITAMILPNKSNNPIAIHSHPPVTAPQAAKKALISMAQICGWVILSKVILCFLERWFLWLLPNPLQVLFTGTLELSNGCWSLSQIPKEGLRFIICCGILSFGGLCVMMQTSSVTGKLGLGMYLPGKLLQSSLSVIMGFVMQFPLFHISERWIPPIGTTALFIIGVILLAFFLGIKKITVAFHKKMLYNPVIPR